MRKLKTCNSLFSQRKSSNRIPTLNLIEAYVRDAVTLTHNYHQICKTQKVETISFASTD